jgi:hypothetical protein
VARGREVERCASAGTGAETAAGAAGGGGRGGARGSGVLRLRVFFEPNIFNFDIILVEHYSSILLFSKLTYIADVVVIVKQHSVYSYRN